jgi:Cu(I)/Ag(I) efflux system membrane protein CusA/SilA
MGAAQVAREGCVPSSIRQTDAWFSFGLAFVGGYGDAASFVLAKTFTGHVTGNLVLGAIAVAAVLIFPTVNALMGGLILQRLLGYNFSVAVWVGYVALFGIAVETGVVMVVYLHEALNRRLATGTPLKHEDIEAAVIEGAVHRLRPKLMTVCVVLASLIPILWETGVGSDVMKPIAAPVVGGMITSTIHVLILVPVFFALMKECALRAGMLTIKKGAE